MVRQSPPVPTLGPLQITGQSRDHVIVRDGVVLQPAAMVAFDKMCKAAAKDGIALRSASSFRDFDTQARIWNQKWRGERPLLDEAGRLLVADELTPKARVRAILLWSAPPGASRHHWGTDLDVYDQASLVSGQRPQLVPAEYMPGGPFADLTLWLNRHMGTFGFYRPYATYRGGVQPEPWHLSHVPTARAASRRRRPQTLLRALSHSQIDGKAALIADLPQIYLRYVRSVDPAPTVLG